MMKNTPQLWLVHLIAQKYSGRRRTQRVGLAFSRANEISASFEQFVPKPFRFLFLIHVSWVGVRGGLLDYQSQPWRPLITCIIEVLATSSNRCYPVGMTNPILHCHWEVSTLSTPPNCIAQFWHLRYIFCSKTFRGFRDTNNASIPWYHSLRQCVFSLTDFKNIASVWGTFPSTWLKKVQRFF